MRTPSSTRFIGGTVTCLFVWHGEKMETKLLSLDKIMEIHTDLASRYGLPAYGTNPEVRDMGALTRVIDRAKTVATENGPRQMSTIAGAYLYDLIHEHPFVDANRRTAAAAALYFLELNGIDTPIDDRLLEEVLGTVAAGRMNRVAVCEFLHRFVQL
jgi:death on curing protein